MNDAFIPRLKSVGFLLQDRKELSDLGCGVGCGCSSTSDAERRCKFFKEVR